MLDGYIATKIIADKMASASSQKLLPKQIPKQGPIANLSALALEMLSLAHNIVQIYEHQLSNDERPFG